MAFGILRAGFIAGAANRVSDTFDAKAAGEREDRLIKEQREYEAQVRREDALVRSAELESQQNFQIRQAEQDALVRSAELDQTFRNNLEIIKIEERNQKSREQLAREDDWLKQLELQNQRDDLQQELETNPNKTIIVPANVGTLYRSEETSTKTDVEDEGPFSGVKILFKMPDPADPEKMIPIPIRTVDREALTEKELGDFGVRHVLDSTRTYLPALVDLHRSGKFTEGFDAVVREISSLSGAALRDNLDKTTTKQSNDGYRVLESPVQVFQLANYLPNQQDRLYFSEQVFQPLLSLNADVVRQMNGVPADVELGYQVDPETGREFWIVPPREKYSWATVADPRDATKKVINPAVEKNVISIAKGAQMPVLDILGVVTDFRKFDDKKAILQDLLFMQTQYKDGSVRYTSEGRMIPGESFQLDMEDRISGMSVDNGINFVRATLPPPKSKPTSEIVYKDGVATRSVQKSYGKKYGRDPEVTGRRSDASRQAVRIIEQIQTLADQTPVQFGAKGQLIKITAGVKDLYSGIGMLVNALTKAGVGIDESDAAALRDAANGLNAYEVGAEISADQVYGPQGVLGILTEQLAFVVAGAFQGGAKGNNISNADVQAARNALSLMDFFGNRQMSLAALEYLKQDMLVSADMNRRYTVADTDEHEFQAVYMYDQIIGGTYDSVAAMLADPNSPFNGMGGTELQQAGRRTIRRVAVPTGNGQSASGFVFEGDENIQIGAGN